MKDTTCSKCGSGVNWEQAEYDEETGEVICPPCKKKEQKQKRESRHEYRFENFGKRPR